MKWLNFEDIDRDRFDPDGTIMRLYAPTTAEAYQLPGSYEKAMLAVFNALFADKKPEEFPDVEGN